MFLLTTILFAVSLSRSVYIPQLHAVEICYQESPARVHFVSMYLKANRIHERSAAYYYFYLYVCPAQKTEKL